MRARHQTLTCLLGDPVDHSVSDLMFQYFAQITDIDNYKHLKLRVPGDNKENLKMALEAISMFDFSGANITLPYKEQVIKYINAIDDSAKGIGAINTIVNKNGKLIGYNTDSCGAIKAIEEKLRPVKLSDKVMILGAGGAARAIISGLANRVKRIVVLNRNSDLNRALKLKEDFSYIKTPIEIKELSDLNIIYSLESSDIIINATSVGMYPNGDETIIKKLHIESILDHQIGFRDKIFFDAIFNPFITPFLKLAQSYGCEVCPGIYMMIYQGLEAFYLWTNRRVPEKEIEKIYLLLHKEIETSYKKSSQQLIKT
ncbi:MAG: shikimate dehydrogenase [Candidatus Paceibacterota bacterium]